MATDTSVDTGPVVAEISRARADFGASLEAVADRLAPRKLIARARMQMAAKVDDLKDRLNPVNVVRRKLGRSQPRLGPTRARAITVSSSSTR